MLSYTGQKDQEIKVLLGAAVCQRLMGAWVFIPAINIYTGVNTPYIYVCVCVCVCVCVYIYDIYLYQYKYPSSLLYHLEWDDAELQSHLQ